MEVAHSDGGRRNEAQANGERLKDPMLFPDDVAGPAVSTSETLFPPEPSQAVADEIVSQHMASHMAQFKNKFNQPTRAEYHIALQFKSNIGRAYNLNPAKYMKRAREETEEQYWKAKRIGAAPGTRVPVHVAILARPAAKQSKKAIKPAISKVSPAVKPRVKVRRTPKSSPLVTGLSYPTVGGSATPEPRGAGSKRPEEIDYHALPDYAPPISTLPKGKSLKADWGSNNPLNLANDPDNHMLHEAEVSLASTLRLTCATYLCSKRRIFEARLNTFRIGKEFRKTDAQQACKIDVNKASKLWTAYDKVGWFDKSYFVQYL